MTDQQIEEQAKNEYPDINSDIISDQSKKENLIRRAAYIRGMKNMRDKSTQEKLEIFKDIKEEAYHIIELCCEAADQNEMNDYLNGQIQTAELFKIKAEEQIKNNQ